MSKQTIKNLNLALVSAGVLSITACGALDTNTNTEALSNKNKAVALITSIETGNPEPVGFINPNKYIQHNLAVADGLEGFGEVMKQLPEGSAKARVKRAFQDGEYVVTHTEYDFFGPKAGFDVFRFEKGKIVEHWDNLQDIAPSNLSGRTQFDGATEITDIDRTEANKTVVADFVNTILVNGDMSQISKFIDPDDDDYLQHNPGVADGLNGLGQALGELAKQGMPMVFSKNHLVIGEGDFVLAISEGEFLKEHVAFYDLFRLANGKIVEHWDTIEMIPEKSLWKNSNSKFGFK